MVKPNMGPRVSSPWHQESLWAVVAFLGLGALPGGSGLSLCICQLLLERRSSLARGAKFRYRLCPMTAVA